MLYDNFVSTFVQKKKKYKPVAEKVKPVTATVPESFRILRKIEGDPLATMPKLSPNPPPFEPLGCYTQENKELIDKTHPPGFLLPEERALMHDFMCLQNQGFAWNDLERCCEVSCFSLLSGTETVPSGRVVHFRSWVRLNHFLLEL
jgi:hypothetical protein